MNIFKSSNPTPDGVSVPAPDEADASAYSPISRAMNTPVNTIYGGDNVVAESESANG
jgi:hypothetical protein